MTGAERTEERSSNTTTATHHCSDTSQGEALVAILAKSIHTYRYTGNTCFVFCLFFSRGYSKTMRPKACYEASES